MNILVSSAGRRGALIRLIQETVQARRGKVFAIDAAPWSSACRLADDWQLVPPFDDAQFFDVVVSYCRQHDIRLIVPTHDRELLVYAKLRPLFAALDIHVACSGMETVAIATDKQLTDHFLREHAIPSVPRVDLQRCLRLDPTLPFPLVVKPRRGSSSQGVQIVHDQEELAFFLKRTPDPIVQRKAEGKEFTTNLFIDRRGRCVVAVPHWRIETRGGEVSKCVTVRKTALLAVAEQLADNLPDAFGPLCFQAFVTHDDQVQVVELNARFGGGYPIAHQAGANFIHMLMEQVEGRDAATVPWVDGLAMTRWDDAVFWRPESFVGEGLRPCA